MPEYLRSNTGMKELDRVLGGGLVAGDGAEVGGGLGQGDGLAVLRAHHEGVHRAILLHKAEVVPVPLGFVFGETVDFDPGVVKIQEDHLA